MSTDTPSDVDLSNDTTKLNETNATLADREGASAVWVDSFTTREEWKFCNVDKDCEYELADGTMA